MVHIILLWLEDVKRHLRSNNRLRGLLDLLKSNPSDMGFAIAQSSYLGCSESAGLVAGGGLQRGSGRRRCYLFSEESGISFTNHTNHNHPFQEIGLDVTPAPGQDAGRVEVGQVRS